VTFSSSRLEIELPSPTEAVPIPDSMAADPGSVCTDLEALGVGWSASTAPKRRQMHWRQVPTAVAARCFLGRALRAAGTTPRYLISTLAPCSIMQRG
jgi:hypothetical protein